MDLGEPGNEENDAIGEARKEKKTEVVSLLERFKENPEKTRSEVRKELGITGEMRCSLSLFHLPFFSFLFLFFFSFPFFSKFLLHS